MITLSLPSHYRFLSDQFQETSSVLAVCDTMPMGGDLGRFMATEWKDCATRRREVEYLGHLWLEMVEVWDRMSFGQKCLALEV